MGIKLFITSLFFISLISLFSEVKNEVKKELVADKPLITFKNSIMYTMDKNEVNRVVQSQKAVRYKSRDELYDGTIVLRVKDQVNEDLKDIISAQKILKKMDSYSFYNDVKYDRGDFFKLRTNELFYDVKNQIAYNDQPFKSIYYGDILNGTAFYMNNLTSFFKAKSSHFEVNMNKKSQSKKN
ncbi:MAG: LPS export ABC transporter periplasmic protein LptC [Candidatus Marinarcus sp.]|uniref:LPS export ABC transporter periplasmic protein LptC n=1 Tax=Candidatus Marinarcus sp. TaxID=3100987 RepID=UPI003B001997